MTFIAVDIGASNIRVASGDKTGLLNKLMEPTDNENGANGVHLQIIQLIKEITDEKPEAIGIGSIGPIDHKNGMITNTPNYPFHNIPITKPLKDHYNIPVTIVNDCAAAVTGEQVFGEGKTHSNLVYVTISTGLGGGAIVDNHLLMGKDGNAVEVGHVTIDYSSSIICGCGGKGHWEAYCSGSNIPKYTRTLLRQMNWRKSLIADLTGGDLSALTSKTIFDAAKQGDEIALHLVDEIGKINAVGFANIVNCFDPELITVGGSIALNNPELILDPVKQHIDQYLLNRRPEIKITTLGDEIVLIGALALAMMDY